MGDSERVRPKVSAYFERFDHLASDLLAVTDAVGASTSNPIFWLAISLSGAVASRALQMQPDAVAGVVLLAPMISLTKISAWMPTLPVTSNKTQFEQERKTDEQNYNGGVRGRVATKFVLVTEACMAPRGGARALEGVSCANVLLMHAWCDNYVDPAGSVAFYERAQCSGSKALLRWQRCQPHGPMPTPIANLARIEAWPRDCRGRYTRRVCTPETEKH